MFRAWMRMAAEITTAAVSLEKCMLSVVLTMRWIVTLTLGYVYGISVNESKPFRQLHASRRVLEEHHIIAVSSLALEGIGTLGTHCSAVCDVLDREQTSFGIAVVIVDSSNV